MLATPETHLQETGYQQARCGLKLTYAAILGILILLLAPTLSAQTEADKSGSQNEIYGGIEICENFITAGVIQITNANNEENVKLLYNEAIKTPVALVGNTALTAEVLALTGQIIQRLYSRIERQYQVSTKQIYLIAGSEFKAGNSAGMVEELSKEVKAKTGRSITFLPLETEIRLGVVSTIPKRYTEAGVEFDNRSQSLWIEIGEAAVKGGYQQYRQPLLGSPYYDFVSFRAAHREATGDGSSPVEGKTPEQKDAVRVFEAGLDGELMKRPGILYRKKVYLSGEIVWAAAAALHPENRRPFVPLTQEDIRLFHRRALVAPNTLLRPDLSRITKVEIRKEVERELQVLRTMFPPEKLLAGAQILNSVAAQCNFEQDGRSILFTRFNQLSLLLTYLRLESQKKLQS